MKIGRIVLPAVSLLCGIAGFAGCSGGAGSSLPSPFKQRNHLYDHIQRQRRDRGTVPVDGNKYAAGARVNVLGQHRQFGQHRI